jgi:hypothetical protein
MWILKNYKERFENLKSRDFSKLDSIKLYDFYTLYTRIPYNKLKAMLFQIIDNSIFNQKWHPEKHISSGWETRCIFCDIPL